MKRIFLDTSVIIKIIQGKFKLSQLGAAKLFVSVVTVGECLKFALYRNWEKKRIHVLVEILSLFEVVPISNLDSVCDYAYFAAITQRNGFTVGQNDLWIAAGARQSNSVLYTYDRDFICLSSAMEIEHLV